jgi:hypothetical protein
MAAVTATTGTGQTEGQPQPQHTDTGRIIPFNYATH